MKYLSYLIVFSFSPFILFSQANNGVEDIDVGIFAAGTNNAGATMGDLEISMKPDVAFAAVPAMAEFNFLLRALTADVGGSAVYTVQNSNISGGSMIYGSEYAHTDGYTYVSFTYNGSGADLSSLNIGSWNQIFNIGVTGTATPVEAITWEVADGNTQLFNDFGSRTSIIYTQNDAKFTSSENSIVLPIKLTRFDATPWDDLSSRLTWNTSSEINGSHFEVERSADLDTWEQVGTVGAVGESTSPQSYDFIDRNVGMLRTSNTFFYRLKMVDNDGSYEYSEVRSVSFDAVGFSVVAYPNPTNNVLKVQVQSEELGDADAYIMDQTGKIMLRKKISLNGICEFDMNNLSSSLYLLKIDTKTESLVQKIIKVD